MSVIFILIACSLLLAGSFLGAFLWASRSGQFEDDYTPSVRILFDDERLKVSRNELSKNTSPNKVVPSDFGDEMNSSIKPSDQCQKTTKK